MCIPTEFCTGEGNLVLSEDGTKCECAAPYAYVEGNPECQYDGTLCETADPTTLDRHGLECVNKETCELLENHVFDETAKECKCVDYHVHNVGDDKCEFSADLCPVFVWRNKECVDQAGCSAKSTHASGVIGFEKDC
jgi:hypothetical protein